MPLVFFVIGKTRKSYGTIDEDYYDVAVFNCSPEFIEKGKNKVLLNIKKNGKDVRKLELKSRFVDAGNEELLHKVMDAIEYATIVLDENTSYGDEAPF